MPDPERSGDTRRLGESLVVLDGVLLIRGRARKATLCRRCRVTIAVGSMIWRAVHERRTWRRFERECDPCLVRELR